MGIRIKFFTNESWTNSEQAAVMNAALVTELEMDAKPASIVTAKNRTCKFFIQKAKLKNLNPNTWMDSLGLNSNKSI